jgi:hypothetical protein
MADEVAEAFLQPYLDAARMSPSHPLRASAFAAADQAVLDNYAEHAANAGYEPPFNDPIVMEAIAEDVTMILRGVAGIITSQEERSDEH